MKHIWLWIKKWWWALVAGLVGLVILCLKVILSNERKDSSESNTESLLEIAKNEGYRAESEILIEHEKKKVDTEAQKKILDSIKDEPDLNIRRKRMARWASQNL